MPVVTFTFFCRNPPVHCPLPLSCIVKVITKPLAPAGVFTFISSVYLVGATRSCGPIHMFPLNPFGSDIVHPVLTGSGNGALVVLPPVRLRCVKRMAK